jgi:uncharacterized protein (TIGR02284 family)
MKTTTTTPETGRTAALLAALNHCIEASSDAQKGYATAAADVRDPDLKTLLQLRSDERAEYVLALQRAVAELGGFAQNRGTFEGTVHRAWLEARLAVEGRNDATVLRECERGERASLAAYDTLLAVVSTDPTLPHALRATVARQHAAVGASLGDLAKRLGGWA